MEFEAVVERAPTNDYALFCLGRALMELGRPARGAQAARARRPAAARTARLPHLPRRARAKRPDASRARLRCYKDLTAFRGPRPSLRKAGARPLFS